MNRWIRLLTIATLTLLLTLGLQTSSRLQAQTTSTPAALIQAGQESYGAGQFVQAVQQLEQAAIAYDQAHAPVQQAQTLSLLALTHRQLGQWEAAEQALLRGRSLLQQQSDIPAQVRAQLLNAQGHLNLAQGDAAAALEAWQQAETQYAHAQDKAGRLGSQINQIQALQSLGFFRRAENQTHQIEQQLSELPNSELKRTGLHSLGNLRREAGDLDRSRQWLTQALEMAQAAADPDLGMTLSSAPNRISAIAISLGNTERLLAQRAQAANESSQADALYQQAIAHYQTATTVAPTALLRVQAQLNQLSLERFLQTTTESKSLIQTLETDLAQLPPSREGVYARTNFAHQLLALGLNDKVLAVMEPAIAQAQDLQDTRAQSYAQGLLGQFYESQGQWARAQALTQSALHLSQQLQAANLSYQWQWQMGRLLQVSRNRSVFGRDERKAEALPYYRAALNTLGSLRGDLVALNPDIQFSFRETVEPVYREYVKLLLQPQPVPQANLQEARRTLEDLQLAELDNFFRDACAQAEAVDIDHLDPNATIVYPILLENTTREARRERLDLIVKLPGSEELRYYPTEELEDQAIERAVGALQRSLRRRSTSLSQVKQEAGQLYDWLIRPWEADLPPSTSEAVAPTLVFVMDGPLRNISPAVLYDGEQYLVEKYTIALTPGLQLLDSQPLPPQEINALIAGAANAPSFAAEGLSPIDNVALELDQVEQQVSQSQILADQEFLKANIKAQIEAQPFSVVHIATHGQFSSNPDQTYILDWEQRIRVKELDNLLRKARGQAATHPIELLILSACETAAGDDRAALGLAGIAIRAGARSTLATLSQVNDASTAQLIVNFYGALKQPGQTKASALRQAQLSFLQNTDPTSDVSRPYFWAPFILVGNWL